MIVRIIAWTCSLLALASACTAGGWTVVGSYWRPDENPWARQQVWQTNQWGEGWKDAEQFYPKGFKPAGSIHIVLRNESGKADSISLTHVDRRPVEDVITTPQRAGRVVWYRLEPTGASADKVEPGEWAECTLRLREAPSGPVWLRFTAGSGEWTETAVSPTPNRLRIESISFSPAIDKLFIYVRAFEGKTLAAGGVFLDGDNRTAFTQWTYGPTGSGLSLAEVKLDPAWTYGSFHLIEIRPQGGRPLMQIVRAWDSFFCVGLFGEVTDSRVKAAKDRGINTYFAPPSPVLDKEGMNTIPGGTVTSKPRTTGGNGMLFYYNHDEPDAHDWNHKALPTHDRLGVNAVLQVLPLIGQQRKANPTVPNLVLVDNTYKPLQWYVYGQIGDVLATDPYVPLRARQLEYVWHALEPARDGSAPKPLLSVMWACSLGKNKGTPGSNWPTPEEERMAVFYALGCGVKGIGYFIDIKPDPLKNNFIALSDIRPLFDEVGRINEDISVLAPYLARGCVVGDPERQGELWTRSLMCGANSIVAIAVNKNHIIDFSTKEQTARHMPAENETLRINLPQHFRDPRVREVRDGKLVPVEGQVRKSALHIKLDKVDTARAFLIQN